MRFAFASVGLRLALLIPLFLFLGTPSSRAADGDLDPTFGTGGKVTTDFGNGWEDIGHAVAIQNDGKIVVAGMVGRMFTLGDFGLARYDTNGLLDAAFGTGGEVTTDFRTFNDYAYAMTIQPGDGKIVAAGFSSDGSQIDFAVARYLPSGALDAAFGTGGKVITPVGPGDDTAHAAAIQSDGKIVVAGECYTNGEWDVAVVRYLTNGTLDASFGAGGKVTTDVKGAEDHAYGVAIQSDGKIVVAGTDGPDFAVLRYLTNGSLDNTFGIGGIATVAFWGRDGRAVALQPDGRIVVAGDAWSDFALARLNGNGSFDTRFSGDGRVYTDISVYDYGLAVAIQSDGRIVAAGEAVGDGDFDLAVVRYNPDGSLDSTFHGDGMVITGFGTGSSDWAGGVAIQSDGKIVLAGTSNSGGDPDFAVVRYQGTLSHSIPFHEDFETGYANGDPIAGRHFWTGSGLAVATNSAAYAGALGGYIPPDAAVSNAFIPSDSATVWVDFRAKLTYWQGASLPPVPTKQTAVFILDTNGYPVVYDGTTAAWRTVLTNAAGRPLFPYNSNNWVRVSRIERYANKTWSLFLNNRLVAEGVGFADPTITGFSLFTIEGGSARFFDNLCITNVFPSSLTGDSDDDGISDAWEIEKLGTIGYGANDDADGDGYSNAIEYRNGTDPLNRFNFPPKAGSRVRVR